jgi:hypothetical protein
LEQCINVAQCPLDDLVKKNLLFLIGIRHEIEHQMTTRIDDHLSAKFMAAALNFNAAIKKHFGAKYSLEKEQAFSIQFSSINEGTVRTLLGQKDLPQNIRSFIAEFETGMTREEYDDPRFSYRVALVPRTGNKPATADQIYQIVTPGSEMSAQINRVLLKETERRKYRPGTIVSMMKAAGFDRFSFHWHKELWREKDAKNPKYQYGVSVEGTWFWYEAWLPQVRNHCDERASFYRSSTSQQVRLIS